MDDLLRTDLPVDDETTIRNPTSKVRPLTSRGEKREQKRALEAAGRYGDLSESRNARKLSKSE